MHLHPDTKERPSRRRSRSPPPRSRSRGRPRENSYSPHHNHNHNQRPRTSSSTRSPSNLNPPEHDEKEETNLDPETLRANSKRECRVYVGNLPYDARASDLKAFMRTAGKVIFSEIMTAPNGVSKGCGVVEYATPEEAQNAIRDLTEKPFMGRTVFIREDRETEARYGLNAPHVSGSIAGKQLFVSNLPYSVGWKDLKDLFRNAGAVVRADVMTLPNGRSKGVGTVLYEHAADAQHAISTYEGYEWMGRKLEVREDKYPKAGTTRPNPRYPPPHRSMGGGRYGGPPPGYGGGSRYDYGGGYGGYGNGYGGYGDPYGGEYNRGPDGCYGGYYDGYGGGGGPARGGRYGGSNGPSAAGLQIYVNNLPFTTTTQDLKELFRSCGTITFAESLMLPNGRSKGAGIVRFASQESMERACTKFHGYVYGGRSLDVHEDRFV